VSFSLWVAGDEWAVGAGGGLGVAEDVNPVVDLFFKFVFVDKTVDLESAEEVADAFADAKFEDEISSILNGYRGAGYLEFWRMAERELCTHCCYNSA
jgi:hypothetical protein